MKKVSIGLQAEIVEAYLRGYTYKLIQAKFGVSRWNIQEALSKLNIKTNRIKSHPRLPGDIPKAKRFIPYLPYCPSPGAIKEIEKDNNPVLQDDLDIMEKMDNCDDTNAIPGGSVSIVVDENDEVRYEKDV